MSVTVNTPYATLSFANIFTPRPRGMSSAGGAASEPVYSCSLLFDTAQQKSPAYKGLQDACIMAAKKEFGENVVLKSLQMPFRDAGEKAYDGYHQGHTYISPWSKNKPGVVDVNRQDILLKEEVWSGQLVRANVTAFAWSYGAKKGVSFGLNHIQVVQSEGRTRLDGRPTATAAFDDGEVAGSNEAPF